MGDPTTSHDDTTRAAVSGEDPSSRQDLSQGTADGGQPVAPAPLGEPAAPQVFELRLPPPVRALAIASATAVAGAGLIVLSEHAVITLLGSLLLGFGVVLAVVAVVLTARLRSAVRVDATGVQVTHRRRSGALAWPDIERVHERGHQLIMSAREGKRDLTVTVPGARRPSYVRLLRAIKQGLDDSRGYRN